MFVTPESMLFVLRVLRDTNSCTRSSRRTLLVCRPPLQNIQKRFCQDEKIQGPQDPCPFLLLIPGQHSSRDASSSVLVVLFRSCTDSSMTALSRPLRTFVGEKDLGGLRFSDMIQSHLYAGSSVMHTLVNQNHLSSPIVVP